MLGRLFGRAKDNHDDTICSSCGRTLLAGEWTQRIGRRQTAASASSARCAARPRAHRAAPSSLTDADGHRDHRTSQAGTQPTATPSGAPSKTKTPRSSVSKAAWRAPRPKSRSSRRSSPGCATPMSRPSPSDADAETAATAAAVPLAPATEPANADGFDAAPLPDEAPFVADTAGLDGEAVGRSRRRIGSRARRRSGRCGGDGRLRLRDVPRPHRSEPWRGAAPRRPTGRCDHRVVHCR